MNAKIKNIIILFLILTVISISLLWLISSETGRKNRIMPKPRDIPTGKSGNLLPEITVKPESLEIKMETGPESTAADVSPTAPSLPRSDAFSHINMGMDYYKKNELRNALSHFEEALKIEPGNSYAKELVSKVSREVKVEEKFNNKEGSHFNVRYEGGESDVAGHVVAIILEEAYQKIGSDLGFYPEDSITAILYSAEQFRDVTRAPAWSGGIYDGKIRIPVGGVREKTDVLEKVIFHEYTHAVVHRMGGGKAPVWLNEGMAQYEEGRDRDSEEVFRYLASARELVPLDYLEGSFLGLNEEQASVAYAEGLSAVKYIIDEYGTGILTRMVTSYKDGNGSEAVVKEILKMTYKEFQDSWVRNLKKRYGAIERKARLPA